MPEELELAKHGLEYLWHEPLWFMPYDDGSSWLVWRDVDKTCEELAKFAPAEVENYRRWHEFWVHALHMLEAFDAGPPPAEGDGVVLETVGRRAQSVHEVPVLLVDLSDAEARDAHPLIVSRNLAEGPAALARRLADH